MTDRLVDRDELTTAQRIADLSAMARTLTFLDPTDVNRDELTVAYLDAKAALFDLVAAQDVDEAERASAIASKARADAAALR